MKMMQASANLLNRLTNRLSIESGCRRRFCAICFWAASFLCLPACMGYPVREDQTLIEAAEAATSRHDWLAAENYWMRAVEEEGAVNPKTHLGLARVLIETDQKERAQNRLDVANALFPANADLRLLSGQLLRSRGYSRAAERNFEIAVAANPDLAEAWLRLAQVRLDLDLPEKAGEAIEAYDRLVQADPRASFVRAQVCASRGELERAMDCYSAALAGSQVDIECLIAAAATVATDRHKDASEATIRQALAWVDRALERDPQQSEASYVKGMLLERLGDDSGAIEAYKRSIELTDHLLAMTRLAQLYARLGRLDEADRMIDRALALNVHASHRRMLKHVQREWH